MRINYRRGFFAGFVITALISIAVFYVLSSPAGTTVGDDWMRADGSLPAVTPSRLLAITDLPPLSPTPRPEDFIAALQKSAAVGVNAAVLTYSWPSLESKETYTFDDLSIQTTLNEGRYLYLGIQVINTTTRELPGELRARAFDDPLVLQRFRDLLDALAPFLRNRVRYLSIGNEIDIYLQLRPEERAAFKVFLDNAYTYLKEVAPNVVIGTTLTDAGIRNPAFRAIGESMDAYFLTYYHGMHGMEGGFQDPALAKESIVALVDGLDKPVVFQEIGFPAHARLASEAQQAEFVTGVFDAWEALGSRVEFLNYFMMYDFPMDFAERQMKYYGVTEETDEFLAFLTSLGLHDVDGRARPAWDVFAKRARNLN